VNRQYRVTDLGTGHRTYLMAPYERLQHGGGEHRHAAIEAGYTCADFYAHKVRVELVKEGFERPLPFDCIPLVVPAQVA